MKQNMGGKGAVSNVGVGSGATSTVRKADARNGKGKQGQYKRGNR